MNSIKLSGKTLKFDNIEVNKKWLHASKQVIGLNLLDTNKMLISDKSEHSDKGFKYFIGHKDVNIIRPVCIIFSQVSG